MNRSNRILPVLVAGDVVAFLVFALAGLRSHDEGATASTLLRVIVPFLGAWLPIAYAMGLFRQRQMDDLITELAKAWAPAWAIGLLLRIVVFGRSFAPAFAVISFLFILGLLTGWRAGYAYLLRRSQRA